METTTKHTANLIFNEETEFDDSSNKNENSGKKHTNQFLSKLIGILFDNKPSSAETNTRVNLSLSNPETNPDQRHIPDSSNVTTNYCCYKTYRNHEKRKVVIISSAVIILFLTVIAIIILASKSFDKSRTDKILAPCLTSKGPSLNESCIFPFTYKGKVYNGCTLDGDSSKGAWCSTSVDEFGNHVGGSYWGICGRNCPKPLTPTNKPAYQGCTTIDGPDKSKRCVFPFQFRGEMYNGCTWEGDSTAGAWCPTRFNDSGQHLSGTYWGNCGPNCPVPPKPQDTGPKVCQGPGYTKATRDDGSSICYFFYKDNPPTFSYNYDDANAFCKNKQMTMVDIKGPKDDENVYDVIESGYEKYVLLGAKKDLPPQHNAKNCTSCLPHYGTWFWPDGSLISYFNWLKGEPNLPNIQHCIQMYYNEDGKWRDATCHERRAAIMCQLPLQIQGRCPKGYKYISGDIIGASLQGGITATLQECAGKCNANSECNSFEHAIYKATMKDHCNLNKEAVPNGPKYQNFVFCSKEGNMRCDPKPQYDSDCCSVEAPCGLGQGDCDADNECRGELVCGRDNCGAIFNSTTADCCQIKGTPKQLGKWKNLGECVLPHEIYQRKTIGQYNKTCGLGRVQQQVRSCQDGTGGGDSDDRNERKNDDERCGLNDRIRMLSCDIKECANASEQSLQNEKGCPKNYVLHNTHCYGFFVNKTQKLKYSEAKKKCGGYLHYTLASIFSREETRYLGNLTVQTNPDIGSNSFNFPWIGLHKNAYTPNGAWIWADGSQVSYTNWNANEPNGKKDIEHCVHIYPGGEWNDAKCDEPRGYICKGPPLSEAEMKIDTSRCMTTSGPSPNMPCVFPFQFKGIDHNQCIWDGDSENGPWCSTNVDGDGKHISGEGNWGNCASECPFNPSPYEDKSQSQKTITDESSTKHGQTTAVNDKNVDGGCFEENSKYIPLDIFGQGRSVEQDARACQSRCAMFEGCRYFSFWPHDGGCHLSRSSAKMVADSIAVSGPKRCPKDKFDYKDDGCVIIGGGSGEDPGKPCVFPFSYKGIEYTECTTIDNDRKHWCSTKVNTNGSYIDGKWGNCNSICPKSTQDQEYLCGNRHCLWENYKEGIDWGFYSEDDNDCKICQSNCTNDDNCVGVECGGNIHYCSWWKRGRCVTESEQTMKHDEHLTCTKADANKKVHSEAYGCSYRGCSWNSGTQGIDWDYYSTTNGNCTYCMNECDNDQSCEGVECGGEHCSWWKNGKCDEAHEHTLSSNGIDVMCVKKRDFSSCNANNLLSLIGSKSTMESNGWKFDLTHDGSTPTHTYEGVQEKCGPQVKWYGWSTHAVIGTLSTVLNGTGKVKLDFGNCWNDGNVNVYLNSELIATAPENTKSKSKTFSFTPGALLEIKDEGGNAVIAMNGIKILCDANQDRNDSATIGTSSAEGSGQGESTDGALNMDYIVYDYDDYLFTTPSPKECADIALGDVSSEAAMRKNGWIVDVRFSNTNDWSTDYKKTCGQETFYGYHGDDIVGSLSTKFKGSGNATLIFGNCYKSGSVEVLLNKDTLEQANQEKYKTVAFSYKKGDVLTIKEVNTAIIKIYYFGIAGCEDHSNICKTISGPSSNKPCIFPFKFRGDIHNDCNWDGDSSGGAWCSTLIDDSGQHVGGKGNWGNCGPKCPIPPNPIQSTSTAISSSITTTTETSTTMVKAKGCNAKTWPDIDKGVICGDCYALINIKSYSTCRKYCESIDLACLNAFEESGDSCTIKRKEDCDTDFNWTSDALCQCTDATDPTAIQESDEPSCTGDGYSTAIRDDGTKICYFFQDFRQFNHSYDDTRIYCHDRNMTMVDIKGPKDDANVYKVIEKGGSRYVLLSARKPSNPKQTTTTSTTTVCYTCPLPEDDYGDFFWQDGSKVTYFNWYPGEPGDPEHQHCIQMFHDEGGKWRDATCHEERNAIICQKQIPN